MNSPGYENTIEMEMFRNGCPKYRRVKNQDDLDNEQTDEISENNAKNDLSSVLNKNEILEQFNNDIDDDDDDSIADNDYDRPFRDREV